MGQIDGDTYFEKINNLRVVEEIESLSNKEEVLVSLNIGVIDKNGKLISIDTWSA